MRRATRENGEGACRERIAWEPKPSAEPRGPLPVRWPKTRSYFPSLSLFFLFPLLSLPIFATGCAYYSFTGASIPENLSTVAIPLVEDNSTSPFTTLADELTDQLVVRFVDQTRLAYEPDETAADALLEVRLTRYTNQPTAVSADETAALNRVTVAASVRYVDQTTDEVLLERSFSAFGDYPPADIDEEANAARIAIEALANDIFTAATSNW